jgi:MFS family permease
MIVLAGLLAQDFNFDTSSSDDAAKAFLIILAVTGFIFALFTGWLAEQKGHPTLLWMLLGFLFTILALLTLGFAPARPKVEKAPKGGGMRAPGTGPLGPPST